MLWMLDEYEPSGKGAGLYRPVDWSSLGRKESTGYGIVFILREALKSSISPEGDGQRAGFGNVAQPAVQLLEQIGVVSRACPVGIKRKPHRTPTESGIEYEASPVTDVSEGSRRRPGRWDMKSFPGGLAGPGR
jgi:glutamate dehydrogenase/leucine dehydrogenase